MDRHVLDLPIVCPAGDGVGETPKGSACRCRVEEDNLLTTGEDPSSLLKFCLGRYQSCPTWRTEKERIWARKRSVLELVEARGDPE